MFKHGSPGYVLAMSRIHPLRRLAFFAVQTGLSSWVWNNRSDLVKRAKALMGGGKDGLSPDTSRPIGDRFVPPVAGPGSSPFEAAKAEEAPPTSAAVAAQEESSNSHVSIVVIPINYSETTDTGNKAGMTPGKDRAGGLNHNGV